MEGPLVVSLRATVLLVDDDQRILRVVSQMLAIGGHRVLTASSAEEAIETFNQCGVPIDLLISDVLMPGIKGTDLAERLCAKESELAVLLMTGYVDSTVNSWEVLEKPFRLAELNQKIARVLAKAVHK